jgi:hypothetical protein
MASNSVIYLVSAPYSIGKVKCLCHGFALSFLSKGSQYLGTQDQFVLH